MSRLTIKAEMPMPYQGRKRQASKLSRAVKRIDKIYLSIWPEDTSCKPNCSF
jgi:hypothetical protein